MGDGFCCGGVWDQYVDMESYLKSMRERNSYDRWLASWMDVELKLTHHESDPMLVGANDVRSIQGCKMGEL